MVNHALILGLLTMPAPPLRSHCRLSHQRALMQWARAQALVTAYDGIELFWYPLNLARVKGFEPAAWDPYADRLMVYQYLRAAGSDPAQYSDRPNLAANLETALGAVASQAGQQTQIAAVQVIPGPYLNLP